ncbi:MAG: hypothetical protein IJ300_00385, partial [Clostridia bacterium]|nr:hypothetical protein [Clostridia bacterium]
MAFKINADKYAYSASPEKVSDNYAAELAKKLVAEEAAARVSGDDVLNTKIVQVIQDVTGAVLQKLDTETAERIAADEELQKNIDDTATDTSAKLAAKADSTAIPYKVSQLENDSGYLTEHQDISGKADKADTYTKNEVDNLITPLQSFAEDAQTQLDATWSEKADKIEVNLRFDDVTVDISDLHNSKADKATTLAGYGITDAYTKEEVRSDISWLQVWCEENEYAIDDLEQK